MRHDIWEWNGEEDWRVGGLELIVSTWGGHQLMGTSLCMPLVGSTDVDVCHIHHYW